MTGAPGLQRSPDPKSEVAPTRDGDRSVFRVGGWGRVMGPFRCVGLVTGLPLRLRAVPRTVPLTLTLTLTLTITLTITLTLTLTLTLAKPNPNPNQPAKILSEACDSRPRRGPRATVSLPRPRRA